MKRSAVCLFVSIAIGAWVPTASAAGPAAKGEKAKSEAGDSAPGDTSGAGTEGGATGGGAASEGSDLDLSDKGDKGADAAAVKASTTLSWQDIVVVPRKAFLKGGRFEFAPFTGTSVNDILIRHYVFGLDLNYFLTDVLWVGLQGNYYIKALTERESLLGLQYNRIPTLNKYLYGGALNFGYVPVYGKFALFNKNILHWEIFASAGVGATWTEIIPRNANNPAFSNISITPNVAIGGRFFLFDWLTFNYAVRDYLILDKFEPANRGGIDPARRMAHPTISAACGRTRQGGGGRGSDGFNIMFYVGVGVCCRPRFQLQDCR